MENFNPRRLITRRVSVELEKHVGDGAEGGRDGRLVFPSSRGVAGKDVERRR